MMEKKVIVVVDDEPRSRQGIKKTIEKSGIDQFDVLTAANATEAMKLIGEKKVHVLITDIRMPEISGLDLLKKLKAKAKDPVVIIISAYSEFDYAHEALELGVMNYLLKPISKQKLMETVYKAVELEKEKAKSSIIDKIVDEELLETQEQPYHNPAIQQALAFIDEHFAEELTLKTVADEVHLNASYLSALFKEELQLTFSEYITRKRVQQAKKLLLSSDLTITEIAEQIGYHTSKYFIKIFKQYEQMTPNVYRKHK
ncbi:two component AraC family transcriptional regulator [Gracilibacillus halophilus YIM-C55.5]|uniref:Two component AraC family transcriptional regulator n=1 Tax=Gracilibacillus halophilus YIM-C55.5 TaxID=1308866 RepID=N4WEQ2_9BACI|nr:two component AraC family transcriptional regulator [Gracilibacillus halophilus YIM-C55.5]